MSAGPRLTYVHDPMCSWCWGFKPALDALLGRLPEGLAVRRLLGGLAPDTEAPMPQALRVQLEDTWRTIQGRIPGTRFNFDFWTHGAPRRSTWRACRAVLAARLQGPDLDPAMTSAIQRAYYLEARNPSDAQTLIDIAAQIGADPARFARDLEAAPTHAALAAELALVRDLGVDGFPALILEPGGSARWRIPVAYTDPDAMLETIALLL